MPYKDRNDPRKKESNRKGSAQHYEANKKKVLEAAAARKREQRKEWSEYKGTLACSKCGASHPAIIDFHHVDRSNYRSVNRLASYGMYRQAREEIKKCIVLCANCHRIHHYEEQKNFPNGNSVRKSQQM